EDVESWEQEWRDVVADIGGRGAVFVAEEDGQVVAQARAKTIDGGVWYVVSAYVRPEARRRGGSASRTTSTTWQRRSRSSTRGSALPSRRRPEAPPTSRPTTATRSS